MSSNDFWDGGAEIESVSKGTPPVLPPKSFTETEEYHLPDKITMAWVQTQLTKAQWTAARKNGVKINPALIAAMADDAAKGLSKRAIMARAGYHINSWTRWEAQAREGIEPYALWYKCILVALASVEEELMDSIRFQANGDWKAAKWLLEQLNKEEYGATTTQNINITGDIKQETSVNYITDTDAVEIARILKEIEGDQAMYKEIVDAEVVEGSDEG